MGRKNERGSSIRVAELFAGIGGFRLGLEDAGMRIVWSNQWEPPGTPSKQFAWRCYETHFGAGSCINQDIQKVLNQHEHGECAIPDFDLLCGGFPCQDYSVAKSGQAAGMAGRKGALWWQIARALEFKKPRYLLLENVDRLLKSPSSQRGRDFAIILNTLYHLGYSVEWRVINAADYGFPQRRKRVFIFGERTAAKWNLEKRVLQESVFARAFPILDHGQIRKDITVAGSPSAISLTFNKEGKRSAFQDAGSMQSGRVATVKITPLKEEPAVLGNVLVPAAQVPAGFYLDDASYPRWEYLKGAKREERVCKSNGYRYIYSEGAVAFPDALNLPSRTILTGEGGAAPSRFKHVIRADDGRLRRLTPVELERLFGFPDNWTDTGMTDIQRAFCVGNALVVGLVRRIGFAILDE